MHKFIPYRLATEDASVRAAQVKLYGRDVHIKVDGIEVVVLADDLLFLAACVEHEIERKIAQLQPRDALRMGSSLRPLDHNDEIRLSSNPELAPPINRAPGWRPSYRQFPADDEV